MTREHERRLNAERAWRMADAPVDHMTAMLAGIVAFRIEVQGVIARSKLSQNRETRDYRGVVDGLERSGKSSCGRVHVRAGRARSGWRERIRAGQGCRRPGISVAAVHDDPFWHGAPVAPRGPPRRSPAAPG
jgi:hypothetical protein